MARHSLHSPIWIGESVSHIEWPCGARARAGHNSDRRQGFHRVSLGSHSAGFCRDGPQIKAVALRSPLHHRVEAHRTWGRDGRGSQAILD